MQGKAQLMVSVAIGWGGATDGLKMTGTRVNLRKKPIDGSYE